MRLFFRKKTAYKLFQRQIRTVRRLRNNNGKWSEMLNLLELTEDQKSFVSKMDLMSYLDDFQDIVDQTEMSSRKLSSLPSSQLKLSRDNSISSYSQQSSVDSSFDLDPEFPMSSEVINIEELFEDIEGHPEPSVTDTSFRPVPYIKEVIKFFPKDFGLHYKVSSPNRPGLQSPVSPSTGFSPLPDQSGVGLTKSDFSRPSVESEGRESMCNVIDSCWKVFDPTGSPISHPGKSRCYNQTSLVRSLLNLDRHEAKPSQEFSRLVLNSGDLERGGLTHLQGVRLAGDPSFPAKIIKYSSTKMSQKRPYNSSKRQGKASLSSVSPNQT